MGYKQISNNIDRKWQMSLYWLKIWVTVSLPASILNSDKGRHIPSILFLDVFWSTVLAFQSQEEEEASSAPEGQTLQHVSLRASYCSLLLLQWILLL